MQTFIFALFLKTMGIEIINRVIFSNDIF